MLDVQCAGSRNEAQIPGTASEGDAAVQRLRDEGAYEAEMPKGAGVVIDTQRVRTQLIMASGHIYFIEAVGLAAIKVGWAKRSVQRRLSQLQIGCPVELRLLFSMVGAPLHERLLHHRFKAFRLRGEWFRADFELRRYIEDLCEGVAA